MLRGINVIGRLHVPCGITIAARATMRALLAAGLDVVAYAVEGEAPGRAPDPLPEGVRQVQSLDRLPHAHTLFLCHPNEAAKILELGQSVLRRHRTAIVLYWELERLPLVWHAALERVDTIFAPSTLVQTAVRACLGRYAPLAPVVPVTAFEDVAPRRTGEPFTFHMSFDLLSSFTRKNPLAGIEAFLQAFPGREDVRFLAKIWESADTRMNDAGLADIETRHPRVRFLRDDLSYERTVGLIADADVYVSLHRSEGLGLGMLEAMSAGRPVVATNYGANTDYLDDACGMPVPYTLEPVDAPERAYAPAALGGSAAWAAADVTEAALAMRALYADRALYDRLSRNARAAYERRRAAFFDAAWLAEFAAGEARVPA